MARAFVLLFAFVTGCMVSSAQRWVGHYRDELVAVRGEPADVRPLAGGASLYRYESRWNASSAGVCQVHFVIDAAGIIRETIPKNCRWNGWIEGPPESSASSP